ncbi:MAG TPA: T9SS type A sorting domain-containing protein [Chitinophagaceae bacterium]|nr:T9SS type A sorting domain-containing protein [Chitinophagaceae bacterium]
MKSCKNFSTYLLSVGLLITYFGNLNAQQLMVTNGTGTRLIVEDSLKLVLNNGAFINNGTFASGKSAVIFTGNANANSFISGTAPTAFYQLIINKQGNDVQLNRDILVTHSLQMIQGNLELNGYTADLGTTGIINNEHPGSLITGYLGGQVKVTTELNAPRAVNPGNIGIEITSDGRYGATAIIRGHQQQLNKGRGGIHRYFELRPSYNADQPMQAKFMYYPSELAGINDNALTVFSQQTSSRSWMNLGKDKANPLQHWIMKSNVKAAGRYTLDAGIKDLVNKNKLDIQLYPNPTINSFRLSISEPVEIDLLIRLLDAHGHLLETRSLQKGNTKLVWPMDQYPQGNYILSFANKQYSDLKVIKQ